MDTRNGAAGARKGPQFGPRVEGLEGRRLPSVTPIIYVGPPTAALPAGAVATAATPTVPHLPTPREQALEQFFATFATAYQASPGRFTDQKRQFFFAGGGLSNSFLHGDIEMALYTPVDPTQPVTGTALLIAKNVANSGNALGVDLVADPPSLDALGRPTHLTWTVNGNSGGTFSGATGSGTLDIEYRPSHGRARGLFGTAPAGLIFRGTVATNRVTNVLRFT